MCCVAISIASVLSLFIWNLEFVAKHPCGNITYALFNVMDGGANFRRDARTVYHQYIAGVKQGESLLRAIVAECIE